MGIYSLKHILYVVLPVSLHKKNSIRLQLRKSMVNSTCSDFPPAPSTTSNSTTFVSGNFSRISLKILIGSVFSISSVVKVLCGPADVFVADLPGKVEVDCSEVSLVYIVVEVLIEQGTDS